jgi:hypothetical protein
MHRTNAAPLTVLAALALVFASAPSRAASPPVEAEPSLALASFAGLPAATGNGYRIDPKVPVSGFHGQFTLHTDLGAVPADGVGMLRQRVAEVGPAAQLQQMSQSDVFVDALARSASSTATALGKAVTNPVDTAKALPAGVGRFFKSVGQKVESATSGSSQASSSDMAKDALGINKAKRQLAQKVGIDPYTTNPILAKRLDELANAAFAGGVSIDVALAVTTAGIGTAISVTKTVSDLAWTMPPDAVRVRNDEELAAFGVGKAARDRLLGNRWYSPSMGLLLVDELKGLGVRKGAGTFVDAAAGAGNETEARFFIAQLGMAREYAKAGNAIAAIEAPGKLAAFRTANGGLFVPAPLDYLSWTERVKAFAERSHDGREAHVIWLTGAASPIATAGLKAHGWTLRERVAID